MTMKSKGKQNGNGNCSGNHGGDGDDGCCVVAAVKPKPDNTSDADDADDDDESIIAPLLLIPTIAVAAPTPTTASTGIITSSGTSSSSSSSNSYDNRHRRRDERRVPGTLNSSANVLLVYRLQAMREMEKINFTLAIICLVYCGINVALIITNYVNSHNEDDPPVSEKMFHLIEFWATFIFAVVECISLTSTPKPLTNIYGNTLVLRLVLFFNIVSSSVPAAMITMNYQYFEIISHEIEYLNELTMSFVDLVLLYSLCRFERFEQDTNTSVIMGGVASLIALIQLAVYNGMGRDEDGDMIGETPAHYLEFSFEIISSLIAFWFCMDNKFVCGKEIGEILYGSHRDCLICGDSVKDFSREYRNPRRQLSRLGSKYGSV